MVFRGFRSAKSSCDPLSEDSVLRFPKAGSSCVILTKSPTDFAVNEKDENALVIGSKRLALRSGSINLGGESSLLVMMGSAVNLRVLGDVESTSPDGKDGEASNSTEIVTFGVTTLVLIRF